MGFYNGICQQRDTENTGNLRFLFPKDSGFFCNSFKSLFSNVFVLQFLILYNNLLQIQAFEKCFLSNLFHVFSYFNLFYLLIFIKCFCSDRSHFIFYAILNDICRNNQLPGFIYFRAYKFCRSIFSVFCNTVYCSGSSFKLFAFVSLFYRNVVCLL